MKNYKNILVTPNSTIREVLKIIDSGAMQIAIVVDEEEKLLGTVTDGDIRRGLLNNLTLDNNIDNIIFKTPTVCKLEDTKEKILEVAVEKKLYQIPIVDKYGKLVGIEEVDELLKQKTKTNKVVLMVGGLGTRLRPLTENIPKPMLKVGNKPILETIILNFKKYGFINIVLCVSYKSKIIENYFKDGSEFGVKIEYVHENKRMGTAGALSLLKSKPEEPFFVMNGDLLTNINFEHLFSQHIDNKSSATMCLRKYDYNIPFGVVNIDEKSKITNIKEKPQYNYFINAGIYLINPSTLDYIPKKQFFDMPSLFEILIKNGIICDSYTIKEYWLDIGRLSDYEKANYEYSSFF
jgi:dTDP-glucose pyrophosphorylase/predicted transcriptional regulator